MYKITVQLVTFLMTMLSFTQAKAQVNPLIVDVFSRIHKETDTVLTRLERQMANQQESLLSVTLGFTLTECLLLFTSLILHVVSIVVLNLVALYHLNC